MRLIDADSLMKKFDPNDVKLLDTIAVRYRIATEETVQSQKVGKWTHDGSKWENRWLCECGYKLFGEKTRFCPDCGSMMMEEGE